MKSDVEFLAAQADARAAKLRWTLVSASLTVIGILALHWRTAASAVAIWSRSETFTHCFIVVPICLWLVWRRRPALAQVPIRPWWPALIGVLAAGALWLIASAAAAVVVKQFAVVFMIQASVIAVLGLSAARVLAFPLAFLLFAVPVGEILVPSLMDWTADFTVTALRWSGVPVYREANRFVIPSGTWSVVEACSGLRYLIASMMVGCLYAGFAYQSASRRLAFIAASIGVPIIANWLRAYIIVMIGHLSNNHLAVGVDHLVYGWVFFGVIMLLLFWIGSFWQESESAHVSELGQTQVWTSGATGGAHRPLLVGAIAAIIAAGIWQPIEAAMERPARGNAPILKNVVASNGWTLSSLPLSNWKPHYVGYASELQQSFSKNGHEAGLYIAYYSMQESERELITSTNVLTTSSDRDWTHVARGAETVTWAGAPATVRRAEVLGHENKLDVLQLYWVCRRHTSSEYVASEMSPSIDQALASTQKN